MVEIGDKIRFTPAAFSEINTEKSREIFGVVTQVTGTVIQIHEEHRWYRVRYELAGTVQHETFKF